MDCSRLHWQRFKTPLERFEEKYIPVPESGCWIWLTKSKYGVFYLHGTHHTAHRASWILFNGPIPDGMLVCHKCDVPGCVNPTHLFLGTPKDNMQDMITKGRNKIVRGSQVGNSKLVEKNIFTILISKQSNKELGKRFGVTPDAIYCVRTKKSWKHIGFADVP